MSGLRITNAILGTVTLHDPSTGVYGQIQYRPNVSTPQPGSSGNSLDDGDDISLSLLPDVDDTATVYIDSGSQSALETVIRAINSLFEQARFYQRFKAGGPVYLEYRTGNSGTWLRSEIVFGWPLPDDASLDSWWAPAGRIQITINAKRKFYWEGAEAYLTLTNQHGTSAAGLTIYNTNDSNGDDFATITTTIDGDLPAPCRLEYTNSYASTTNAANVLIGHSAIANPAPADLILETANLASVVGSPATNSSAAYSGGSQLTWSFSSSVEQALGYWNIPTTLLQAGLGLWYRLLARIPTSSTSYQIKANVRVNNLSPLWDGNWVTPSGQSGLVDLGAVQLPPYLRNVSSGTYTTLTLGLSVRPTSGPTYSVPVDCIHIVPLESWRMLRQNGFGLAQSSRLLDDQMIEQTYTDNGAGANILGNYVPDGSPIYLKPGRTNRLYLHVTNILNVSEVARTGTLRIAYRPRYRVL